MKQLSLWASALALTFCAAGAIDVRADEAEWQSLTVSREDGKKCEMRVPAGWTLQDKGANFAGAYAATLFYEAEKPEVWWTKRKKVDLKNSRMFQDSKTTYWFEIQGALISGGDDGAVHISGIRSDDLVCHVVLELKSEKWRDEYAQWQQEHAEMLRVMLTSLKPN